MPEQLPPPNPQDQMSIPMPPSHLVSAERWSPPKRPLKLEEQLLDSSNPTFLIDTSTRTNIDVKEIGIEGESPAGAGLEVIGFIKFGGDIKKTGETEYKIPIIRETSSNGLELFTIMGYNPEGKPKAVHTFSKKQDVHIGRSPEGALDHSKSEVGINLNDLGIITGDRGSVSRDHLTLTWTNEGINVVDHSTFGSKVEAIRKPVTSGERAGSAVTSLSGGTVEQLTENSGLVDSVPKNAEEVAQSLHNEENRQRDQRLEKNAPRLQEIEQEFQAMKNEVGDDEMSLLWQYGSYSSQRREFAAKGDSDNDNNFRKYAEEALGKMKPGTSKYKDTYWQLLSEKSRLTR